MRRYHAPKRDALLDRLLLPLFLAVLPIALWLLTGNPIPGHLPSRLQLQMWWAGLQHDPLQALDVVPRIVVDTLWIAWAWYAACTLLGTLWALLRLPAVVVPRVLLRLTPRTTVQAITAGAIATAPAVHATPAPAHTAASTHRLPKDLDGRLRLVTAAPPHRALRPGLPLSALHHPALADAPAHTVAEGDTLWDLALHYYGDGEAWRRIFAGNLGRQQSDGRYLTKPDLILPGWTLIIPGAATATPASAPPPGPQRPTTAPDASRTPTTPGAATSGPVAPAKPSPDATRPHVPAASGNGDTTPRHRRPAATPRTVGWHITTGGYIGITLIASIAASIALLRTRTRLRPDTTPPIPAAAEDLAVVHQAAKRARTPGHLSADSRGETPPRYTPQPGIPMLGTSHGGQQESWYDPGLRTGPLALTGPGAEDVARAFVLSVLGASDLDIDLEADTSPLGLELVLTDRDLARDLLGAAANQHLPGWLHLTDTPQAAVAHFHAAARRRAQAGVDAEHYVPSDDEPLTVLIARTNPALHESIVEACLTDPTAGLGAILLGEPTTTEHTTTLTIDENGAITSARGPRAGELAGQRCFHTPHDLTAELFGVLHAAREVYHHQAPAPDATPEKPNQRLIDDTAEHPSTAPAATHDGPEPANEKESAPRDIQDTARAETPDQDARTAAGTTLLLRVLGPTDILGPDGEAVAARGERTRAILAALAVHPTGLRTPQLADLIWDQPMRDARTQSRVVYSALRRTRDQLRTAARHNPSAPTQDNEQDYILLDSADRYHLDPAHIATDLQLRTRLEDQADHTADPDTRLRLLLKAAALDRGPLADGIDDDGRDWLTTARYEQLLHTARLHLRIAELTAATNTAAALDHVKRASAVAPDDRHTRAEAIRLYQQLDRPDLAHALSRRAAS